MPRKNASRKKAKTPPCPECGSSSVVPTVHGVPSPAQCQAINKGRAILASREEWEGMTEWYCKNCGCDWSGEWRRFKRLAKLDHHG
jgi:predicted RNA-binding Zn-ribbon protein involved in translation (DUF1610 family)